MNILDSEGRPAGGDVGGVGIEIIWQSGPMREPGPDGKELGQNGAFVEDVIQACIDRIEFYNGTQFRCRENSLAVTKLEEALHWLNARTARRVAAGTEGTHEGS